MRYAILQIFKSAGFFFKNWPYSNFNWMVSPKKLSRHKLCQLSFLGETIQLKLEYGQFLKKNPADLNIFLFNIEHGRRRVKTMMGILNIM